MVFDIIKASKNIALKYKRYLKTMFDIEDKEYKEMLVKALEENSFEKGPFLDVVDSFEKGRSIKELIEDKVVDADMKYITKLYKLPSLYKHQEVSLLKVKEGENVIVSTGTGSGKTESFMLPIINSLMEEKRNNGKISDGVRALLIFPMNALANDQIDRLRKLFKNYPDITFGSYTGQTPKYENKKDGKNPSGQELYEILNKDRIDDIDLRKPLVNERLSRETMKERPPHILITNYAMLEFLMLRPEDNVFFDGPFSKNWKYIVLDEAHTYTGSTGIEVSLLLRRVKAKLNNKDLNFILTSATLGDENSNSEVVKFATSLCTSEFKEENIVRASRLVLTPKDEEKMYELSNSFYNYVSSKLDYNKDDLIELIQNEYDLEIKGKDLSELLYNILIQDKTYWKIKKYMNEPKSIEDICKHMEWSEQDVVNFVEVASLASKDDAKLFDARYHMFLRATEGVFITLTPHKDLFLTRKKEEIYNEIPYKVFEVATCVSCHKLYILGEMRKEGTATYLIQKSSSDPTSISEAFLIGDTISDEDEDSTLLDENLENKAYKLCPHCGLMIDPNEVNPVECGHPLNEFINIIRVKNKKENGRVTKCLSCGAKHPINILRGFFTGQEASTSVIGTALFEELPEQYAIKKIKEKKETTDDDIFNLFEEENENIELKKTKAKQFLAFSDSRQAAAYYASYVSISYSEILYRRILKEVIENTENELSSLTKIAKELSSKLKEYNAISYIDEVSSTSKEDEYYQLAWKILLKELVEYNSRNSLIGLGVLGVSLADDFFDVKAKGFTKEELRDICTVFALGMISDGAISGVGTTLSDADREFYIYGGKEINYELTLTGEKNKLRGFLPKVPYINKRYDYLRKILIKKFSNAWDDNEKINNCLSSFWKNIFIGSPSIMLNERINVKNINIEKNRKWYRCPKCNKITQFNVNGVCPTYLCDGELEEFDVENNFTNNHYYRMYCDLEPRSLRIVEHTAQLNKEEAYRYQNMFKEKNLDVLSCSTTFEMGVDVGELETVFMRNMPPTTANYAQRAGRAGRSSTSAAYALTFCNKSNHDFNYFENPLEMINGIVKPPQFNIENEKISIRHLYSSVLSFFFNKYSMYFKDVKTMLEKSEQTGLCGYDVLEKYCYSKPKDLKEFLMNSLPNKLINKFGVDTFEWVDYLFKDPVGNYPNFKNVKEVYFLELIKLEKEKDTLIDLIKNGDKKAAFKIREITGRIENYQNEDIISFLSRNNILPRYGFPVDSVELKTNDSELTGLQLARDLSIAIAEYAPGCEIVAKNRLITSQYVTMHPSKELKKYDYVTCSNCETLNVEIHTGKKKDKDHPLATCKQCGQVLPPNEIKTFIIPEFGFITKESSKTPTLVKPEKTYRTEASFVNYTSTSPIKVNNYKISGFDVSVEQMENDGEMAVLNTQQFLVCPICGYAEERDYNDYKGFKGKHKNPQGFTCSETQGNRLSLGYQYKTDVMRLKIGQSLGVVKDSKDIDVAYSLLQALIIAASETLNIEYSEIAGCLQYYCDKSGPNYSYILYDKTPGGAGHVRRINNEKTLQKIIENAYYKVNKCNCGEDTSCYKCLRTYQNQRHHDSLQRRYVTEYLSSFIAGSKDEYTDSELEDNFLHFIQAKADSVVIKGNNKNIYELSFNNQNWRLELQVELGPKDNVVKKCKPDCIMTPQDNKQKKIAIFLDGFKYHKDIVDDDSLKRNAIMYSKNYRVFSFGYEDIKEACSIKKNDKGYLNELIKYLSNSNAEEMFRTLANEKAEELIDKELSNNKEFIDVCLDKFKEINECVKVFEKIKEVKEIGKQKEINSNLEVYEIKEKDKNIVISLLNDLDDERTETYLDDWYNYLHLNNILQFADKFICLSEKGLNDNIYKILNNVKTDDIDLGKWQFLIKNMENSEEIEFVKECAKRNIPLASEPFDLDDGSVGELVWEDQKIIYLTSEQIKYKKNFEKEGYTVVTTILELEKALGGE